MHEHVTYVYLRYDEGARSWHMLTYEQRNANHLALKKITFRLSVYLIFSHNTGPVRTLGEK